MFGIFVLFRVCVYVYVHILSFSVVSDSVPGIIAHQAPLSVGFSRQKSWSGSPFPTPGNLPNPDRTHISQLGRWILVLQESPFLYVYYT